MIAFRVLVVSILSISTVVVVLSVGILIGKARREWIAYKDRKRREIIEPRLLVLVHRNDPTSAGEGAAATPFRAAFGPAPGSRDRRVLEAILADHSVRVEGIARERISQAFDELGFVDRYLRGLKSRTWWWRAVAAERLGLARSARSTEALVTAMSDAVPEVRLRAAKALGEIRGKSAVLPLIDALGRPNRWSTLRVAEILSRMGAEAAEGIREAYPALPAAARLASLDILAKLRRLESLDFLRDALKAGTPDERARAAWALGATAHPAPVGDLVEALRDPDWPVRAMAAKAIGRIGSPDTARSLASALTDKQWWVRSNAAAGLKAMGPRGQEALLGVLQSSDGYAREQAVLMLEESGVLEEYVATLDSRQEQARGEAEGLIRRVVKLGRIDYLGDLARDYPNPRIRARLNSLLEEGAR